MIFIDELSAVERKLKARASIKEISFYQKLIGDPIPYPKGQDLVDIEQVCLSAFCQNSPSKIEIVRSLQRSRPIKGMHYSNNILELIACAIYDFDGEKGNLRLLCDNASARDSFILNKLFPGICRVQSRAEKSTDRIAVWLYNDDFPADWKSTFISALQDIDSLLDVYVIREGYVYLFMTHPFAEAKRDVQHLSFQAHHLLEYIRKRKYFWFNLQSSTATVVIFALLAYLAYFYWDAAEPIAWIAEIAFVVVGFLLFLYGRKFNVAQFISRLRTKMLESSLRKAKIDIRLVQAMIEKYSDE